MLECDMHKLPLQIAILLALLVCSCRAVPEATSPAASPQPASAELKNPPGTTPAGSPVVASPQPPPANPTDPIGTSPAIHVAESVEYTVVEHFRIANHGPGSPSKHNLWAALIRDQPPFQQVLEMTISSEKYRTFEDEQGNLIAEFDLSGLLPGESLDLEIRYRIKVNRLEFDLTNCEGDLPAGFTTPELYIESNNPQIVSLAAELSAGKSDCLPAGACLL